MEKALLENKTLSISLLCILVATFIIYGLRSGGNVEVVEMRLIDLPRDIDGRVGMDLDLDASIVGELDTDGYLYRSYQGKAGAGIVLYIGYYGTAKGGRSAHSPGGCYPGSGWSIKSEGTIERNIVFVGDERLVRFNRMVVCKDGEQQLVYHWYQSGGDNVLAGGIAHNLHRTKNLLINRRNDGAFVRVSVIMKNDELRSVNLLDGFVADLVPCICQYWPVEE